MAWVMRSIKASPSRRRHDIVRVERVRPCLGASCRPVARSSIMAANDSRTSRIATADCQLSIGNWTRQIDDDTTPHAPSPARRDLGIAPQSSPRVIAHPLRAVLAKAAAHLAGRLAGDRDRRRRDRDRRTASSAIGEGLARRGAPAYARFIEEVLAPLLIGKDPRRPPRACGSRCARALSGRTGGQLVEAIAGARHRALGHCRQGGRPADPQAARRHGPDPRRRLRLLDQLARRRDRRGGGRGGAARPDSARSRSSSATRSRTRSRGPRFVRRLAGDDIALYVDANWAYDVDDAMIVGRALADLGYDFFEEPIPPHDRAGYRRLAQHCRSGLPPARAITSPPRPLAMLQDRSLGLDAAGRRPLGRHHRDLAHRRTRRDVSTRPMRRMSAGPARSASRPACSLPPPRRPPHLRMHGLRQPAAPVAPRRAGRRSRPAARWPACRSRGAWPRRRHRPGGARRLPDRLIVAALATAERRRRQRLALRRPGAHAARGGASCPARLRLLASFQAVDLRPGGALRRARQLRAGARRSLFLARALNTLIVVIVVHVELVLGLGVALLFAGGCRSKHCCSRRCSRPTR